MTSRLALPGLAVVASVALVTSAGAGTAGATVTSAGAANAGAPSARPAYLSVPDRLYGAAATSPSDVWAVGLTPNSSLIMHWNGRSWGLSFTEPVGYFFGVSATSTRNAWAVGGTNWFSPTQTLIEHWNGKIWTQVPSPSPGPGGYLQAVSATSASNAWAVGLISPGGPGSSCPCTPLILHWNGKSWKSQRFTEPNDGGQFSAVSATSATNAWAVGFSGSGPTAQTLIEHWNGKGWARLTSYAPNGEGVLAGVVNLGPGNVWADGYTQGTGVYKSLIEHWNGHRWHVVPSPNPTGQTNLTAMAATSSSNAWAVGFTNPNVCGYGPQCQTAAFHWNGRRWSVVPTPNPPSGYLNAYLGVVAISAYDAWAVGTTDYASTLISHWNGKAWN